MISDEQAIEAAKRLGIKEFGFIDRLKEKENNEQILPFTRELTRLMWAGNMSTNLSVQQTKDYISLLTHASQHFKDE